MTIEIINWKLSRITAEFMMHKGHTHRFLYGLLLTKHIRIQDYVWREHWVFITGFRWFWWNQFDALAHALQGHLLENRFFFASCLLIEYCSNNTIRCNKNAAAQELLRNKDIANLSMMGAFRFSFFTTVWDVTSQVDDDWRMYATTNQFQLYPSLWASRCTMRLA